MAQKRTYNSLLRPSVSRGKAGAARCAHPFVLCASQKRDRVAVLVRRDAESEAEQTRRVAHNARGRAGPLSLCKFRHGCTQPPPV